MKAKNQLVKYIKSIVLIMVGAMLFSCENDLAVVQSLIIDENTPIESSYDVDIEYSDSGVVIMRMQSPEIHRYIGDEEYLEMPLGIQMVFYDTTGAIKSTLNSDYAINYVKKKIMEARNHVVATNAQGQQLYTEILIWDQEKHQIYTDKKVKVVTDDKILFGDGLIADESFENWEISNPTGDIIIDEEIESDTIE